MNNGVSITDILLGILFAGPAILNILVILGGLVFAVTRIRKYPKPATWLAAGLALVLVSRISGWVGNVYLARTYGTENGIYYQGVLSGILTLVMTSGLVSIIYAVFVSRSDKPSEAIPRSDQRKVSSAPLEKDSNPYSTPSAG